MIMHTKEQVAKYVQGNKKLFSVLVKYLNLGYSLIALKSGNIGILEEIDGDEVLVGEIELKRGV